MKSTMRKRRAGGSEWLPCQVMGVSQAGASQGRGPQVGAGLGFEEQRGSRGTGMRERGDMAGTRSQRMRAGRVGPWELRQGLGVHLSSGESGQGLSRGIASSSHSECLFCKESGVRAEDAETIVQPLARRMEACIWIAATEMVRWPESGFSHPMECG